MMDVDLNSWMLFRNAEQSYQDVQIVTQRDQQSQHRYTYADFTHRVRQLITALDSLALSEHARVATMAWNSFEHLECYFAIPCSGRVLHTVNARLSFEDLVFILNDADDEALIVPADLAETAERLRVRCPGLRHIVVFGDDTSAIPSSMLSYEALLSDATPFLGERSIPETAPLGICYTSGTTGRPKGVLATHRSTYLHTLTVCSGNGPGLATSECVLPIVPMFHVYAWGLPFGAVAAGSKIVFPTPSFDPKMVIRLINEEEVTKAAGVPTIWIAVLDELHRSSERLDGLKELLCGGSQPPYAMIKSYLEEYDVRLLQAWGMTETSPIATTTRLPHALLHAPIETQVDYVAKAGVPVTGIATTLLGDDHQPVPHDGKSMGDIYVRGPWVLDSYMGGHGAESFEVEGWFRTGDVGVLHPSGVIELVDRTKDLIKSGGEWISSVALEGALMGHPKILEAAVIAVPDAKWQERPLATVVPKPHETITLEEIQTYLLGLGFPKWQLPDRIEIIEEVPRTSVGKFDKKVLRARFGQAT
ncbi:MAG: long-chain fatty acid--CoA ligase [Ferrimicrobium sp.]|uniref:long-chain fatty acid--CoA ligase n=1 Tax=Ferrimicrobium sp. TaxID=2926050 RepID=UPI0026163097|nr:long-chain fatty acid--CoA ligase [Ferrimicrobium sp.]